MVDSSSLPRPPGTGRPMTPTEKAKSKPRPPVGGAPAPKMPDFAEAEAQARDNARRGSTENRPQPSTQGGRSPQEIKADLQKLNDAVRDYETSEGKELPKPVDTKEANESEGTASQIADMVEQMDDFELDAYAKMLDEDMLNNERRRLKIEERIKPMDLVDLVTEGEVMQKVPIVPGTFEVTYRSVSSGEDLEVKRMLYNIRKEVPRYQLDAYSIMSLTLAIYAINGHPLPDHRDESGNFSEAKFRKKFELVKKYPLQMVADIGVNYIWFDVRVKKLFTVEALGNG